MRHAGVLVVERCIARAIVFINVVSDVLPCNGDLNVADGRG